MLNQNQIERLNEFTFHKHAKQRILLYLLAEGFSIQDVLDFTVKQLKNIEIHPDYDIFREEMLESQSSGAAFKYPSGVDFKAQDVYRIIRQATNRVIGHPLRLLKFQEYIRGS